IDFFAPSLLLRIGEHRARDRAADEPRQRESNEGFHARSSIGKRRTARAVPSDSQRLFPGKPERRGPGAPDFRTGRYGFLGWPDPLAEYTPVWLTQKGVDPPMIRIERALQITLPARQSAFLWGPRKTGKSTYLRSKFPDSLTFDLLQTDLML